MIAKINLNSFVKVKLTPKGEKVLLDYYGGADQIPSSKIEVDAHGYTVFQLHQLMAIYGEHQTLGADIDFETDMYFMEATPVSAVPGAAEGSTVQDLLIQLAKSPRKYNGGLFLAAEKAQEDAEPSLPTIPILSKEELELIEYMDYQVLNNGFSGWIGNRSYAKCPKFFAALQKRNNELDRRVIEIFQLTMISALCELQHKDALFIPEIKSLYDTSQLLLEQSTLNYREIAAEFMQSYGLTDYLTKYTARMEEKL